MSSHFSIDCRMTKASVPYLGYRSFHYHSRSAHLPVRRCNDPREPSSNRKSYPRSCSASRCKSGEPDVHVRAESVPVRFIGFALRHQCHSERVDGAVHHRRPDPQFQQRGHAATDDRHRLVPHAGTGRADNVQRRLAPPRQSLGPFLSALQDGPRSHEIPGSRNDLIGPIVYARRL